MKYCVLFTIGILILASAEEIEFSGSGSGSGDIPGVGSGDFEFDLEEEGSTTTTTIKATTTVSLVFPQLNGDNEDGDEEGIIFSGSGQETTTLPPNEKDVRCDMAPVMECWCVDDSGVEIRGTRQYMRKPDCSQVTQATDITRFPTTSGPRTSPSHGIPTRVKPYPMEIVTDTATEHIHVVETETSTPTRPSTKAAATTTRKLVKAQPPPFVKSEDNNEIGIGFPQGKDGVSTGKDEIFDNKIPGNDLPKDSKINEKDEEKNNQISGTGLQVGDEQPNVRSQPIQGGSFITHPGILAAVIAGGVVGLLCAVLCVMFIVYRMRKKDEGSYPLDDSRPPRLHTYTKPSSREFYA